MPPTATSRLIAGNFEDKYNTRNPLLKWWVERFLANLRELLGISQSPDTILEVGAGEGYLIRIVYDLFPDARITATDLSPEMVALAQKSFPSPRVTCAVQDAENLRFSDNSFDLVIACEVLEHVPNPRRALAEIHRVTKRTVILSVPREPLWRMLNCLRGKYLASWGNTPGHLNNWSRNDFIRLVEEGGFRIAHTRMPLPWTMALAIKQ